VELDEKICSEQSAARDQSVISARFLIGFLLLISFSGVTGLERIARRYLQLRRDPLLATIAFAELVVIAV